MGGEDALERLLSIAGGKRHRRQPSPAMCAEVKVSDGAEMDI